MANKQLFQTMRGALTAPAVDKNREAAPAYRYSPKHLLAQYAVSYVLPDGVKPNKRFQISTKKRGVSLRAPSTIPDR